MCLGFWFFNFFWPFLFFRFLSFCCSVKCMSYQNNNQNRSINKVQNLGKKGKYAKTLSKIQVTAVFLQQDMQRTFLPNIYKDLYGDYMVAPIQISTNMAAENQQKHLSLSFATKAQMYLLRNSKTLKQHFFYHKIP